MDTSLISRPRSPWEESGNIFDDDFLMQPSVLRAHKLKLQVLSERR